MVPLLAHMLTDSYDAIRSRAYETLRTFEGYEKLDYDFLGPVAGRQAAKSNAMKIWNRQREIAPRAGDDALLLDDSGGVNDAEFQRLLRWRDNRPVTLAE